MDEEQFNACLFCSYLWRFDFILMSLIAGPANPDSPPEDGKLKTAVMTKENRRYYLDMKENQRGRFLRVSIECCCTCARLEPLGAR